MNVVILAAGLGSRFGDVTANVPKCLLTLGEKCILEMQLESLLAISEVEKIFLVIGHQKEKIAHFVFNSEYSDKVELIENLNFATTNNMYSLFLASNQVRGKEFILCNGDVAFTSKSVLRLSKSNRSEILIDSKKYTDDNMKVIFNLNGDLVDISKTIKKENSHGISMDVYKFSQEDSETLFQFIEREVDEGRNSNWTEMALSILSAKQKIHLKKVEIEDDPWFEIDNQNDIRSARDIFLRIDKFYQFEYYFFDLDGTLLIENEPIVGALDLINDLQKRGKRVYFLTNNSAYSDIQHAERLTSKGFRAVTNQVVSALGQSIDHLLASGIKKIFFLGTDDAKKDLVNAGIRLTLDEPHMVVIGNDTELSYNKIQAAIEMIHRGVPYILTHSDFSRPTHLGPLPDVGAWALIIRELTGKSPDHVFGKPDPGILESVIAELHMTTSAPMSVENSVIVGDRLNTDILLGFSADIYTILTLTGSTKEKTFQESALKPNLTINSISNLLKI
jgi:glycerol-1-phosphatase